MIIDKQSDKRYTDNEFRKTLHHLEEKVDQLDQTMNHILGEMKLKDAPDFVCTEDSYKLFCGEDKKMEEINVLDGLEEVRDHLQGIRCISGFLKGMVSVIEENDLGAFSMLLQQSSNLDNLNEEIGATIKRLIQHEKLRRDRENLHNANGIDASE